MAGLATDVFVSYKAEDRARLKPLVAALEAEGFDVWWDAHIGTGADWREEIQQHLDAARCVIVAWSERSAGPEGHFVRDEATRAKRRGSYVPVRLDDVELPLGFGDLQAPLFSGWKGKRTDPRFVALVDAVKAHVSGNAPVVRRSVVAEPKVSRRTIMAGGVGALAVAGVGGWALLRPGAAAASNRIAVMSFSNMSGEPGQAYFSDGIAEELRGALSRVGMQVIGKASCDAVKELAIPAAAAKLGVANILTGSVRRSPETIRVGAQLVNGKDGVEIWAQDYDRAPGDTIMIQTDIATQVAGALSIALGTAKRVALTLGGTVDAKAQDLILQCRKFRGLNSADSFHQRIALADAAIGLDPNYADAYVAKAAAFTTLAILFDEPAKVDSQLAEGEAAARKAIAIAQRLGSPHSVLAFNAQGHLNFRNALRETKIALALAPNNSGVLESASRNLALLGTPNEAMEAAERGISLDPLNAGLYSSRAEMLFNLRRYSQAIEAAQHSLRLAPSWQMPHLFIGDAFLQLGKSKQAKTEYDMIGADNPLREPRLALLAARTGDHIGAERATAQLKQRVDVTLNYQFAEIFAQLGDKDRAFAELGEAVRAKDTGLAYLKVDPFLDPIRSDTRFAALLKRLSFSV
jgi:TolB-like protein